MRIVHYDEYIGRLGVLCHGEVLLKQNLKGE